MYITESLVLAMMKEFSTKTGLFSDLGKNTDHSQPQEALDQKLKLFTSKYLSICIIRLGNSC